MPRVADGRYEHEHERKAEALPEPHTSLFHDVLPEICRVPDADILQKLLRLLRVLKMD